MLTSVALFEFFLIFFASSFTLVLVFSIFQTDYLKKRANAIVTGILVVNAIQGLIGAVHSIYWILYAHGFLPYNHSSKLFSTISSFFLLSASSAFDWFNIGIILKRITLLIFPLKKQLKIATTTVILFVVSVATIFGTVGFSIIYLVDPTNVLQDTIPQGCFSVGCGISHPPISKIFLVDFPIASTVIVITLGIFLLVLLKHNNIQLSKNIRMVSRI
ncbi:hypothetical protein L596_006985 [Steinernema carpocapsae]|uniref:G-protein coupled receptors family 1 profile domain-containing protein n=1 Tax=Steinernema carpocapsae TaxID=34508 RepID=A0A4U5P8V7_STECR|nr:hypothetical protein L596_006985 [Steinernema carpocapsae]